MLWVIISLSLSLSFSLSVLRSVVSSLSAGELELGGTEHRIEHRIKHGIEHGIDIIESNRALCVCMSTFVHLHFLQDTRRGEDFTSLSAGSVTPKRRSRRKNSYRHLKWSSMPGVYVGLLNCALK